MLALVTGLCALALPSFAADMHRQPVIRQAGRVPVPVEVPVPPPAEAPLVVPRDIVWPYWDYNPPYVFLAPTYYESFAVRLRLPPPPPGLQWVRRGRDLALVDPRNGYVADYRDNVFRGSPLY
jgi:hypothetical protein